MADAKNDKTPPTPPVAPTAPTQPTADQVKTAQTKENINRAADGLPPVGAEPLNGGLEGQAAIAAEKEGRKAEGLDPDASKNTSPVEKKAAEDLGSKKNEKKKTKKRGGSGGVSGDVKTINPDGPSDEAKEASDNLSQISTHDHINEIEGDGTFAAKVHQIIVWLETVIKEIGHDVKVFISGDIAEALPAHKELEKVNKPTSEIEDGHIGNLTIDGKNVEIHQEEDNTGIRIEPADNTKEEAAKEDTKAS